MKIESINKMCNNQKVLFGIYMKMTCLADIQYVIKKKFCQRMNQLQ